jgi:hypothetical protein
MIHGTEDQDRAFMYTGKANRAKTIMLRTGFETVIPIFENALGGAFPGICVPCVAVLQYYSGCSHIVETNFPLISFYFSRIVTAVV